MAVLCNRYVQTIFPKIVARKRHVQRRNDADVNFCKHETFGHDTGYSTLMSCCSIETIPAAAQLVTVSSPGVSSRCCQHRNGKRRLFITVCCPPSNWSSARTLYLSSRHPTKDHNYDKHNGFEKDLMDFPRIVWPSITYTIKNWILSTLIIRPYLDGDFNLDEFATGAKQAVALVSSLLRDGNLEGIKTLVTSEAFGEIQRNLPKLSLGNPDLLSVKQDDMYFSFPYRMGIMLPDTTNGVQKRFVEIMMCFHYLLGSEEIKRLNPTLIELQKYKARVVICNCRFIKEFTKGSESDWTINIINFFQPHVKHSQVK